MSCRVPKGGVFKGGGNWGTLRIPREDWGTLGKIREPPALGPPLNNPINVCVLFHLGGGFAKKHLQVTIPFIHWIFP